MLPLAVSPLPSRCQQQSESDKGTDEKMCFKFCLTLSGFDAVKVYCQLRRACAHTDTQARAQPSGSVAFFTNKIQILSNPMKQGG